MNNVKPFNLYKGLQRPLVFKSFKGKYIYWGVGSILLGLILTMIISSIVNIGLGLLTLIIVMGGGLWITSHHQKKGLNTKNKDCGVFIVPGSHHRIHNHESI